MQVPGQWVQASGRAKGATGGPNTRKVSFFALAFRRVVMSLEGKKGRAMGWASGVFMMMTANDRMLWLTYFRSVAGSREMR